MLNKTLHALFIAIAVCGLIFMACDKSNNPMVNVNDDPDVSKLITPPAGAQGAIIWAGQYTDVGHVYIWFTTSGVRVLYQTDDPYHLTEYHIQIALNINGIPISGGGGPAPGQFDFKDEIAPTNEVYFEIPFSAIEGYVPGVTELIVAAHCVVVKDGEPTWQQTGWAGENPFPGHNWARYFEVTVGKTLSLPSGIVSSRFTKITGGNVPSLFQVANVGAGYDIVDGNYNSWCLDEHVYIYQTWYTQTHLWASVDVNMPSYCRYNRDGVTLTPYDKINWLLNAYLPAYTGTLPIAISDEQIMQLQHCFWYYRGSYAYNSLTAAEKLMVGEADAHGVGFWPLVGQWMAVIIDNGSSIQICFLLVDP